MLVYPNMHIKCILMHVVHTFDMHESRQGRGGDRCRDRGRYIDSTRYRKRLVQTWIWTEAGTIMDRSRDMVQCIISLLLLRVLTSVLFEHFDKPNTTS